MKIVYLTPFLGEHFPGITNKLLDTVAYWRTCGHEVTVLDWGATSGRGRRPAAANYALDVLTSAAVLRRVRQCAPDVVVVRHYLPLPGLARLARHVPVVLDIHTDDIAEYEVTSRARVVVAGLGRRRMFRSVAGATFVTRQAASSASFDLLPPHRLVVGNSVALQRVPAPENDRPLVTLAVGAPASWQGLDVLERIAAARPECDFQVLSPPDSAGGISAELASAPRNLVVVSCGGRQAYVSALARSDVALGVIALSRVNRAEASPLKVRDAVALGIPVLLPYYDPTFDGVDDPRVLMRPHADADADAQARALHELLPLARTGRLRPSTSELVSTERVERERLEFLATCAAAP